ncbi:MAG: NAD(P)-dependent oxidoreductase [Armatimonadota bacterium]|nr:MAG: NAD(P)-dependent oxidoreductase [Armatimonadota bacterium]
MTDAVRVVITGASGHLGSHLAPALVESGFEVTGLDIVEPASPPDGWTCARADLTDAAALADALAGAQMIVHCASIHPWKPYTDDQYLDSNVRGTWSLYATAADLGIERIVLTSSIAAAGYHRIPPEAWPVSEDRVFPLGDLYSFTKRAQEEIARMFADLGRVQTIALRPPAFMPKPELETGFMLTGSFAVVQDIVSAHVAAARVLSGLEKPGEPLRAFEAINTTNALPYKAEDGILVGPDWNVRRLVEKYWPRAYDWLVSRGYKGSGLAAVYDLGNAERLLGWHPTYNFEQWFAEHGDGPLA